MKAFGTARLGSDMEVRFMPNGDPVGQVSLAFKLGKKDKEGNYITQWIRASLFGKRAESLAPYLLKGNLHAFVLRDLCIEEFTGKDGESRVSMQAIIDDVELCGNKDAGQQEPAPQRQPPAQQQQQQRQPQQRPTGGGGSSGFDDMDDDIPFATAAIGHDVIWRKLDRARVV